MVSVGTPQVNGSVCDLGKSSDACPVDPKVDLDLRTFLVTDLWTLLAGTAGHDPYKPSLLASCKGIPGFIPTFPTEH